ncbi:unnamed protein product [Ixodes persulcatus]
MAPDIAARRFARHLICVIRHVMKGLVSDKILAKSDLERVVNLPYGHNDKKNRPEELSLSFITGTANMKGTASRKWFLFRLLPLIFCSSVHEGNPH